MFEHIEIDELGRYWRANDNGPFAGPYDTLDDAEGAMPDADDEEADEYCDCCGEPLEAGQIGKCEAC